MERSEELEVLKLVTLRLTDAGISYMVTGSIAGNFYAVPRMTRDIDIVVELSERYVDQIVGIFQEDFYIDRETVLRAVREKGMFKLIHTAYVMKVDFVVRKDSNYRREEFSRRRLAAFSSSHRKTWSSSNSNGQRKAIPRFNLWTFGISSAVWQDSIGAILKPGPVGWASNHFTAR